ncbi:cellulase family glycosylhydrolase [Gordonia polyisoprenivorans]|uniref:endo-1,4-beta-xylanase n=1 Tax=Gordonia polyisoprenivorans TaxID=84595 RepID=UPI001B8B5226|nr:cellulase family glycosylhydrolase [Gordonia polyisoprenivorans]QUD81748.1 cellulase family glycosylhydrolase [Gordonia polyisoprenivorans]
MSSTRVAALCATAILGFGTVSSAPFLTMPPVASVISQASPVPIRLVAVIDQSSTTIGIADSSLYGLDSATLDTTLDHIASLGVTSVRVAIPWMSVEAREGTYDWTQLDALVSAAQSRGISIVATLTGTPAWAGNIINGHFDPDEYADFVSAVATRYKNEISGYEIWNEPNAALFYNPIDPTSYTAFLKDAYTAIKAADPNALVIAGVLGATTTTGAALDPVTFVQEMYAAGAAGYFDALSFHPYQFSEEYSENDHADSPASQVTAIQALMAQYGDAAKKIWITEYGEPTTGSYTQAQQAAFIQDFIEAWQNQTGAGPIYIYTTRDTDTGSSNIEDNFGLYETDWTPKPAAQVLADLIAQYSGSGSATHDLGQALASALQQWVTQLAQSQLAAIQQLWQDLASALQSMFGASATTTTQTVATAAALSTAAGATAATSAAATSAAVPAAATPATSTTSESSVPTTTAESPTTSAAPTASSSSSATTTETAAPVTTAPATTVPESTVPETSVPDGSAPATSAADTATASSATSAPTAGATPSAVDKPSATSETTSSTGGSATVPTATSAS